MQVTVEDLSTVKKKIHVLIPESDVNEELNKAYKELKRTAKVRGFRPGKAPLSILRRQFGKGVNADVSRTVIQNSMEDAVKETKLVILEMQEIQPPEYKGKGDVEYEIEVEVSPQLEDIDFKGLKVRKDVYEPGNAEVNLQLLMHQKNLAKHTPIEEDRPVENGDHVLMDYEGFKDGEPFAETAKTENVILHVGAGGILKELDEGLIGMNPGETREIPVTFPEDYVNRSLANLDITFHVKIHDIREETLPEIDDNMAKQLGEFEGLDQLKEFIAADLKTRYALQAQKEMQEQAFAALEETLDFEVPEVMIRKELEKTVSDFERSLAQQERTLEDADLTKESIEEKYRETAVKQIRRQFILQKIVSQENIEVSDEELDEEIRRMARVQGNPYEEAKKYVEQTQGMADYLKSAVLEKKAVRLILDNSDIEEKTLPAKEEAEETPADAETA